MANKRTLKRRLQRKRKLKNQGFSAELLQYYIPAPSPVSFANCYMQAAPSPTPFSGPVSCVKKKDTNMAYVSASANVSAPINLEAKRIDFLAGELREARDVKISKAELDFGMIDDDSPTTPKEFVKRIQDGLFVIPKEYEDRRMGLYGSFEALHWRDPAKVKDSDGYEAACDQITDEADKANRIIVIKTPDEGLAALQAFEAWQPTGVAN